VEESDFQSAVDCPTAYVENSGEIFGCSPVLAGAAAQACGGELVLTDDQVWTAAVGEVFGVQHFNIVATLSFRQWKRIVDISIAVVINSSGIVQ
jgi:hypothetical protein